MPTQKKIEMVSQLADKVNRAKALFLADYRGLKHKQLEELRKVLTKVHADFTIVKNRLMIRALGNRAGSLKDSLTEPTAVLFAFEDETAPLSKLLEFFKGAGAGKMKTGLMGETLLSESDVTRLARLPSRQVLLAQLVGQLKAPITGLHYALSWNLRKLMYSLNAIIISKS
jgi:large subunit ribosomal protein L10